MPRLALLLPLLALGLAACALRPTPTSGGDVAYAAADESAPAAATPSETPIPLASMGTQLNALTPTPPPTSTPTLTPIPTATPIAVGCGASQGAVERLSVPSSTLHYPIDALIYLPPCYYTSGDYFPVLYLIHGLNYKEDQWNRIGAPAVADALTAAGEIAPLIIVMPRDRLDDRFDPAFVQDLVPYIDQHYHTRPYREFRAVGGLSRGGGWAIHLGLHYPEVFGRIGAHSPAVFYGDGGKLMDWTRHLPAGQVPAIYLDIGQGDSLVPSAAWLDQMLTWFKVEHSYILEPGAHTEKYWSAHMADYLRFYAGDWRFAVPTPVPDAADLP